MSLEILESTVLKACESFPIWVIFSLIVFSGYMLVSLFLDDILYGLLNSLINLCCCSGSELIQFPFRLRPELL
jgi:hypothetical protein